MTFVQLVRKAGYKHTAAHFGVDPVYLRQIACGHRRLSARLLFDARALWGDLLDVTASMDESQKLYAASQARKKARAEARAGGE